MITQDDAEKATQFLVDTSYAYGEAKALAQFSSNSLRRVKAIAMKHSHENAIGSQEREAYASDQYKEALKNELKAHIEYEKLRAAREAAVVKVDLYRTISARQRGA